MAEPQRWQRPSQLSGNIRIKEMERTKSHMWYGLGCKKEVQSRDEYTITLVASHDVH